MGPTRPWVWSCWIEEIREPAKEESQSCREAIAFWQESHGSQELQQVNGVTNWPQGSLYRGL